VRLLLDTHLLIWAAGDASRISPTARSLMEDRRNALMFSVASLWEMAIKNGRGRPSFRVDLQGLRRYLRADGYVELGISSEHALAVESLPPIHKDPFDRLLVAQAIVEDVTLLTVDRNLAKYPAPIRSV